MARKSIDDILTQLKPFGRIQKLFFLSSVYMMFFLPMLNQAIVFLGATPGHHCTIPPGYYINQTIPLEENESGDVGYSQCLEYVDPINPGYNGTQECQNGWEYSQEVYGETIISEWDLVCSSIAASETSQSVLQIGGMFGAIIFGKVSDSYGRRACLRSALVIYNLAVIGVCFAPNFYVFLILWFLGGFGQTGTFCTLTCIVAEYMIPKYRNAAITIPQLSATFGLMFVALLAFLIRDWRYLQLAMQAPVLAASVGLWFLPESLRWLVLKNKGEKMETLIRRLSRINETDIPSSIHDEEKCAPTGLVYDSTPATDLGISVTMFDETQCALDMRMSISEASAGADIPDIGVAGEKCAPRWTPSREKASGDANGPPFYTTDSSVITSSDPQSIKTNCPTDFGDYIDECESKDYHGPKESGDCQGKQSDIVKDAPSIISISGSVGLSNTNENTSSEADKVVEMKEKRSAGFIGLFKPPVLRITIVMGFFRFTICLVYFGFALNTGHLAGNPYLNFFFSALVEIPAKLLSPVLNKWFRRTYLISVCYLGCFLSLMAMIFTPNVTDKGVDLGAFIVVLSLMGKFFVTLSMAGLDLLIMELFPTTVRNIGSGFTLCLGRLGGIVAPFMLYADVFLSHFSTWMMAACSLVTALTILLLPDTRKTPQPQNPEDLKDLFIGSKKRKIEVGVTNTGFEPVDEQLENDGSVPSFSRFRN